MEPSGWWCQESESPTASPAPTVSEPPSTSPTASPAPTVSPAPTDTTAPSAGPTVSPAPTTTSAPSAGPSDITRSGAIGSVCSVLTATYADGEAILCKPSESECPAAEATAGVVDELEANQELAGSTGYNVDVTFLVAESTDATTVAEGLDATVTSPVVLSLIGCPGKARNVALEHYKANTPSRRNLQSEKDGKLALMNNWECGK